MTIKVRKYLYLVFIVIFLILTPLVSMYADGYKFDLTSFSFEKTGMLIINSVPKGAKVLIDGRNKYYSVNKDGLIIFNKNSDNNLVRTPAKVKGLLAGDYDISLQLDGYWPWSKKLNVQSGSNTFAENIVLFKQSLPVFLDNISAKNFKISPNKKTVAGFDGSNLSLVAIDNDNQKITKATTTPSVVDLEWSPDSKNILVGKNIFNSLTGKFFNSGSNFNDTKLLKWGEQSQKFYFLSKDSIAELDLDNNSIKKIYTTKNKIIDFLVYKNEFYVIEKELTGLKIKLVGLDKGFVQTTYDLPFGTENLSINKLNDNYLYVVDKNQKFTYLFDRNTNFDPWVERFDTVNPLILTDGRFIMYFNDFEIWLYDSKDKKTNLLTRQSQKITDVKWHPSNNYILFANQGGFYTLELDTRDKRNITQILNISNHRFMEISDDGHVLYFFTKIGNREGIYDLEI